MSRRRPTTLNRHYSSRAIREWGGIQPTYPEEYDGELVVSKTPVGPDGYSKAGRYFGAVRGAPVFSVDGEHIYFHLRAANIAEARRVVRDGYPNAKVS